MAAEEAPSLPRQWGYNEVSEVTGLPIGTLRYMRHRGEGPRSYKLGRSVRFAPEDVLAWIEAQKAEGVGYTEQVSA